MLQLSPLQGSGEADFSGNPFGFMDEKMPDATVNFPALFTTQMSSDRSADVLQYLLVSTELPYTCSFHLCIFYIVRSPRCCLSLCRTASI